MPTKSPQLRILEEVGARLVKMTVANGYNFTVAHVDRARAVPFETDDLPACNYWPGVDSLAGAGHGFKDRTLELYVEYFTRTRDVPYSDIAFELGLDVSTVLSRETTAPLRTDPSDPTLGGIVKTISLNSIAPLIQPGQAPWCGVMMTITIDYRVKATDPSVFV